MVVLEFVLLWVPGTSGRVKTRQLRSCAQIFLNRWCTDRDERGLHIFLNVGLKCNLLAVVQPGAEMTIFWDPKKTSFFF